MSTSVPTAAHAMIASVPSSWMPSSSPRAAAKIQRVRTTFERQLSRIGEREGMLTRTEGELAEEERALEKQKFAAVGEAWAEARGEDEGEAAGPG